MLKLARILWNDESGQGLSEYALLLGLIVVGVVATIAIMGGHIKTIFTDTSADLGTAAAGSGTGGGGGGTPAP